MTAERKPRARRQAIPIRAWPLSAKVMGVLALALLPMGVLALSAADASYRTLGRNEDRLVSARLEAVRQAAAPRLEAIVSTLRAAAILGDSPDCRIGLGGLASTNGALSEIALFGLNGRLLCAGGSGSGFPRALARIAEQQPDVIRADYTTAIRDPETGDLVLVLRKPLGAGRIETVVGRVPAERARQRLVDVQLFAREDTARLLAEGRPVAQMGSRTPAPARDASLSTANLLPSLTLELSKPRSRINTAQALGIALPALMWLTALAICWVALDSLVTRPLRRMREAVVRYGRGDRSARITPAAGTGQELLAFARAFDFMADRADRHEAEMQAALARQTALTREVHHRVKNNLQIVSSLLSLQARGVENPEVAAAYAVIRQRVTALSLVHRWIYAGSSDPGVDLRGLLSDLCANIAHSFERTDGGRLQVHCSSAQLVVHQDIALPIAFLVSELAANAVYAAATRCRVEVVQDGAAGVLTMESDGFEGEQGLEAIEPAARRIIAGLTRQLRGELRHDPQGRFAIRFALLKATAPA